MNVKSVDCILGLPFNIASYAILTTMIANECGFAPGKLKMTFGDTHVYQKHVDTFLSIQQFREPKPLPKLKLLVPRGTSVFDIKFDDFELTEYAPDEKLNYEISV